MKTCKFVFVEEIPFAGNIDQGKIYVSLDDDVAQHKCMCGCGIIITTAISPVRWKLIYNGKYSLYPSIGNWSIPCKSHYWIEDEKVIWSRPYTAQEIEEVKEQDYWDLKSYLKAKLKRLWL